MLFRTGIAVTIDDQPGMRTVGYAGNGFEAVNQVGNLESDGVSTDIQFSAGIAAELGPIRRQQ